jgi:hypothetical protein
MGFKSRGLRAAIHRDRPALRALATRSPTRRSSFYCAMASDTDAPLTRFAGRSVPKSLRQASRASFVAGWARPALARAALAAVVRSPSCLADSPSYARNATAPIDPAGCSARAPNANRGRIADMLLAGRGRRALARRIDRPAPARRAHTRRRASRELTRQPARQTQPSLSSPAPVVAVHRKR